MWKVSTPVPWPRSGGCGRRAAGPHRKQTRVNGGGGGGVRQGYDSGCARVTGDRGSAL